MELLLGGTAPVMRDALAQLIQPAKHVSVAVSFLQVSGWDLFQPLVSPVALATTRVLCDDKMGITNPEAVRRMLKAGVDVRAYSDAQIYHPKVFLAATDHQAPGRAMLGSANLSEPALMTSVEAGVVIDDADGVIATWFDDMFDNRSAVFDNQRLAKLEANFAKRMKAELGFRQKSNKATSANAQDGRELIDALFSGLGLYIAPLSFDQAGNNIRNIGHARSVLAMSNWTNKQRSEMKLLGFSEAGQFTPLGQAALGDPSDAALAKRWIKWLKKTPDAQLATLSGNAALVQFKSALRQFWTMRAEVRNFFLHESGVSRTPERTVLQAIELLSNVNSDVSSFTLDEIRALAPLLGTLAAFPTNVRQTVSDYMRNKWTRDWGIPDRRLILEAWRDA